MPRNVMVAIPTRDPSVKVDLLTSYVQTMYELGEASIAMTLFCWSGDPLISHARNTIIAQFMTTDCTDLFFLDDDVSWKPGEMLRMLNHPVDFVAGAYRHKRDPQTYPINWFGNDLAQLQMNKNTGLILVRDAPFGFARLTRAAVQLIWDHAADKRYFTNSAPGLECRVIFDMAYIKNEGKDFGEYYGEDYVFCQRYRELGGQVWVDPELDLVHHGFKQYQGKLGDWLRTFPVPPAKVIPNPGASGRYWPQVPEEVTGFAEMLKARGVTRYLEIGSRYGDTFGRVMQELGEGAYGVAVDWPGADGYENDGEAVLTAVADKYGSDVVIGNSQEQATINKVRELGPFDAILIDGDHTYAGALADWANYGDMAPIVAFHDIANPTKGVDVPRVWAEVSPEFDFAKIIADGSIMGFGVIFKDAIVKQEAAE